MNQVFSPVLGWTATAGRMAVVRSRPFSFRVEPTDLYVFSSGGPDQAGLRNIRVREETVTLEDTQMADTGEPKRIHVVRMEEDWFLPGAGRVVGSSPGRLYVTRPGSSVVLAVDRDSGGVDWHLDLAAEREEPITDITSYVDPTDVVRAFVTFDESGYLVAYRLFGTEAGVR